MMTKTRGLYLAVFLVMLHALSGCGLKDDLFIPGEGLEPDEELVESGPDNTDAPADQPDDPNSEGKPANQTPTPLPDQLPEQWPEQTQAQ